MTVSPQVAQAAASTRSEAEVRAERDRKQLFIHIMPKCDHDWTGPEVRFENGSSMSCAICGKLAIVDDATS